MSRGARPSLVGALQSRDCLHGTSCVSFSLPDWGPATVGTETSPRADLSPPAPSVTPSHITAMERNNKFPSQWISSSERWSFWRLTKFKMDQFGMDLGQLGHGEIAMDLSDETLLDDKFSPRRTRSGRVYDSSTRRTRHRGRETEQSPRSRNSSGQSGTGSETEQEPGEEFLHLPGQYFQSHTRITSRRLDLSEDQELPISSFLLDDILSPKKFKVDGQIYLSACLHYWSHKLREMSSLYNFVAKIVPVKT